MDVSREEAAAALAAIQRANHAARSAFRAHRGHYHLWLWGVVWIAMALLAQTRGEAGVRLFPWVSVAGLVASTVIGFLQSRQVRAPVDARFFGALAVLIGFAVLLPLVFRPRDLSPEIAFAYTGLVVAQAYVLSGVWFDTYMVWFGLVLAGLILLGLLVFTSYFWIWIAVCTGGAFLLTGFYVRYYWR
ncbi:MAG: hypothetical protein ABIZ04_16810 [Opitutus sp.]